MSCEKFETDKDGYSTIAMEERDEGMYKTRA